MYPFIKKEISIRDILYLFLILTMSIGIQVIIINLFSRYAVLLIIFFILFLTSIIVYAGYLKDFSTFLLVVNFLPLLLLDNNIHYDFHLELISFIPLFILIFLAVCIYLLNENNFSFRIRYLELPIILIVIYFGISALIALSAGRGTSWILIEYVHVCLYLTIIPFSYLFKERKKYFMVLKFLLLISILISIEYIIYNLFIIDARFVTFQSGFLPLTIGVVFAYILFNKEKYKKLGATFVLIILITGIFVTLTRTLWVVSLLVIISVFLFYLKYNNRLTFFKLTFLLLVLIIPIFISGDFMQKEQKETLKNKSVEYRAQSISNPLGDTSFLMRIELGYYAVQKFLEKPILGNGLGSYVKYKIFVFTPLPVYYLDSTWLYMLWKGGLIGFLLFAWLYLRFFRAAFFVLKNSTSKNVKIICLGLIGGFIGLLFLAMLSPLLIKYKTNVLIAFLFAYIEFERRTILSSDIKTRSEYPSG